MAGRVLRGCLRLMYTVGVTVAIPSRWECPHVLNGLNLRGAGAEVGVHKGLYSKYLLRRWKGRRLYSIDPWIESAQQVYPDAVSFRKANTTACCMRRGTVSRRTARVRRSGA